MKTINNAALSLTLAASALVARADVSLGHARKVSEEVASQAPAREPSLMELAQAHKRAAANWADQKAQMIQQHEALRGEEHPIHRMVGEMERQEFRDALAQADLVERRNERLRIQDMARRGGRQWVAQLPAYLRPMSKVRGDSL